MADRGRSVAIGSSVGGIGGGSTRTPARGNNTLDFMGDRLVGAGGFSTIGASGSSAPRSGSGISVIGSSLSGAGGWNPSVVGQSQGGLFPSGPAGGGAAGGGSTNFAAADPNMSEMTRLWQERLAQMRDPNYTQRAKSRATGDIMDRAAGARDKDMETVAALGRVGSGGQVSRGTAIDEAAKRASARASTDIDLGHEANVNSFLLGGQGIMEAPARLGLAQQGLGLQQRGLDIQDRESVAGRDDARLGMILGLMRQPSYAYAGGF